MKLSPFETNVQRPSENCVYNAFHFTTVHAMHNDHSGDRLGGGKGQAGQEWTGWTESEGKRGARKEHTRQPFRREKSQQHSRRLESPI